MTAIAILVLAVAVCAVAHVVVMAAAGTALGLRVNEIAFGYGPHWFKRGRLRLGVVPLAGWVRFATLPEDVLSVPVQLLLVSTGVAAMLLASVALLGVAGLGAFVDGFRQWLVGASSPFGAAQPLVAAMRRQALEGPFLVTLGLTAAKLATLNVVPWPGTNGGQALAILGRRLGLARRWPESWTRALHTLSVIVIVSWLAALAWYVSKH
jgi:hypothetical protein